MPSFLRIIPPKRHTQFRFSIQFFTLIHTSAQAQPPTTNTDNTVVSSMIESLHKGLNWGTLSEKYSSAQLTNQIAQKILLQLKEPVDSRKALSFFHWSAKQMNFQHGIFTYCLTINILAKSKMIKDAKALLESIIAKACSDGNAPIFTILHSLIDSYEMAGSIPLVFDLFVQTCAKLRMFDGLLDACVFLNENGFVLSVITLNTLLHVLGKSEQPHLVWGVYGHMIGARILPNEMSVRIMVDALSKEGKLKKFLDMVDRMHGKRCSVPGVIVNTCLVHRMIEEGRNEDGLLLLKWLLQKNLILDTVSYCLVIFARLKMGKLDEAKEIYEEMVKRGFEDNVFVYSLFIGAYCDEGRIQEAIKLLEEIETLGLKPFGVTLDHLIKGCSRAGQLEESLEFCDRSIKMGFLPSRDVVNEMLKKLCENGDAKHADKMLTVLLDNKFEPDENTYSCLISGYAKNGSTEEVLKLYYEMEYRSIPMDSSIFTSLIISLCQSGRVSEANEFLVIMKTRSLVPSSSIYKSLIAGHMQKGNEMRARQLYNEMVANA